jgi:hypothetical protein
LSQPLGSLVRKVTTPLYRCRLNHSFLDKSLKAWTTITLAVGTRSANITIHDFLLYKRHFNRNG